MKVFVAGATGVLGRAAVPRLVAAGHEVRGVARSPEKADQLRAQGAEPVTVDLFDPVGVRAALDGSEGVIHMATHIPTGPKMALGRAWAENDRLRAEGTPIMVAAAIDAGARVFVKEGVCFAYLDGGDRWLDEDAPMEPSPRMDSGREAEAAALGFADEAAGRRAVSLRFGLFYSHDASSTADYLELAELGQAPMVGPADAYQPSIHVDDAAGAIVAALDAPTGAYNVADEPITKGEWSAAFVDAFALHRNLPGTPELVLEPGKDTAGRLAASRRVSSQRFRDATGWAPKYPDATTGLRAVATEWEAAQRG
jgi:nucleoside-diphosphate-sugar epimerase